MPRTRVEETIIDTSGGGPDTPLVEWAAAGSGVVEGDADFIIRVRLVDPVTGQLTVNNSANAIVVPFEVDAASTATFDVDYWFVVAEGSPTKYELPFVRIAVGKDGVDLFVHVNSDAVSEGPETGILNIVAESGGFFLDGADLGSQLVHTLTIQDPGAFTVFFEVAASSIDETDTSQSHFFTVKTSIPVPAGDSLSFDLIDLGTGSAVDGVDFTGLPLVGITMAPGISERLVFFTVLGDTSATGNRTVDCGLDNLAHSVVTPVAGNPSAHRVTIIEDDEVVDNTGEVSFAAGDETVAENGTLFVNVLYSAGSGHDQFSVDFEALGILPDAARPGIDYTIDPSPLLFNNGESSKVIRIDGIPDVIVEPNRSLQLTLTAVNNPPGGTITIGARDTKVVTVLDQGGPPEFGQDGDLTDFNGQRRALERVSFDASLPHLRVLPPGVGANSGGTQEAVEAVFIPAGFTDWQAGALFPSISGQNFCGTQRAIELAEQMWIFFNGANGTVNQFATTQAVPVGFELEPVLIEFRVTPFGWDPLRFRDAYIYKSTVGGSNIRILQSSSQIRWGGANQPDNRNIRDLILYTEKGNLLFNTEVCVSHPKWEIGTSGSFGNPGILDNVRWERINCGPSTADYTSSCFAVQGASGDDTGSTKPMQGRLKLYDCQFGMAPRYDVSGSSGNPQIHNGPARVIRSDPACWDIRHSDPVSGGTVPWPPFWPGNEHAFYVASMVGPATYSDLDYNWHPQGPVSANVFLNLFPAERHAPTHFNATPTGPGGAFEGPPHSSPNTFMQWVQRPNFNSSSDASSGETFLARCFAKGVAGTHGGGGIGFAIYGHAQGEVYWKDCGTTPHFATGIGPGGIQFLEDGSGNNQLGVQGRFRLESPAASDRRYTTNRTVIDGFTLVGDAGGKTPFKFNGVRSVKLRKYDLRTYIGGAPQMEWNGVNQQGMNAFCEEFDTSELVDPDTDLVHDGLFSAYPGWRTSGSKIKDEYHANWNRVSANEKTLTDTDVDNLPSVGPPSYAQTNGITQQQFDNRLTATGDGLGTVDAAAGSPTWSGSAYQGGTVRPVVPNLEWELVFIYLGESLTEYTRFKAEMEDPIGSGLRAFFDLQFGPGISAITLEVANQDPWTMPDTLVTWATAVSPRTLDPVFGTDGVLSTSLRVLPDFAEDDVWDGTYSFMMFRARADLGGPLATGTKLVDIRLRDPFVGGSQPDFEYPLDSGTFVETTHTGPQDIQLRIVPIVDFSEVDFGGTGQAVFTLTGASEGDVVTVQALRLGGATPDSQELTTLVPLITSQQGGGVFTVTLTGDPNDNEVTSLTFFPNSGSSFLIALDIIITDLANWVDGDSATVVLDIPGSENAAAGDTLAFTINFED